MLTEVKEKMYCLHCGDCCKRMSPLSAPAPCPLIREAENFIFCSDYEHRPEECQNHTFHGARFCPIGLDVLKLVYPEDIEQIRDRIDMGHAKLIREFEMIKEDKHALKLLVLIAFMVVFDLFFF